MSCDFGKPSPVCCLSCSETKLPAFLPKASVGDPCKLRPTLPKTEDNLGFFTDSCSLRTLCPRPFNAPEANDKAPPAPAIIIAEVAFDTLFIKYIPRVLIRITVIS
ncbi:MAG: hypothetical protein DDT41_01651 [candidate division WS2 bacterium]|nr:hypothetical protein [Candidatus Psychracetigena formicireducens]